MNVPGEDQVNAIKGVISCRTARYATRSQFPAEAAMAGIKEHVTLLEYRRQQNESDPKFSAQDKKQPEKSILMECKLRK